MQRRRFPYRSKGQNAPEAQAELKYLDLGPIKEEVARFKKNVRGQIRRTIHDRAVARHHRDHDAERASTTPTRLISPRSRARCARNTRSIADAGFLLQIDAPDLAMARTINFQDKSDAEFLKICEIQLDAINKGIEGIPREQVRLHCCWGNWEGPHIYDIALEQVLPILLKCKAGALSLEFANPRHAHEYGVLQRIKLPKDMILIPGVIESTSNFVEHPEVVAQRIEQAVAAIGDRERVIASSDCGFGTFTGREWVIAPVVWKKLEALRRGADIASARLWGKKSAA